MKTNISPKIISYNWIDKMGITRKVQHGYYKYIKGSKSSSEEISSPLILDIAIPVVEKDLAILPYTIESVKHYINHPVKNIYIISPNSDKIKDICKELKCTFINEITLLSLQKMDFHYIVNGINRTGWLYQQFLKLSLDSICSQEYFLMLDADTVLLRPQVFEINKKIVFLHSDEHHQPYYNFYKKLFGKSTLTNLSFTSHQCLMQKSKLTELKNEIEQKHACGKWYYCILKLLNSTDFSLSEQEIYGQWMLHNYPDEMRREYWFNIASEPKNISKLNENKNFLAKKYRSISYHHYLSKTVDIAY